MTADEEEARDTGAIDVVSGDAAPKVDNAYPGDAETDAFLDEVSGSTASLPAKYRLLTNEQARSYSLYSVYFAITASAINTKMLNPNFALMASPGVHPDSFPDTEPFDFNSATYFLPMCTLLGVSIASVFIGTLSDRLGRKRVLLMLSWISTVGSIVKYFTRATFWGFCASNFAFGFFLGNLPVGMAYVGDIFGTDKAKKADALGVLVGSFVAGNSGGGVIAILMNDSGLFSALWVGAALMAVSAYISMKYMIDPKDMKALEEANKTESEDEPWKKVLEPEETKRPDTIDKTALSNVIGGAILDNIGSTGLFPLCLSPLALETFTIEFEEAGKDPLMSITGYQWLSVCVALLVIPSTNFTPWFFNKMGVAATCVFGNCMTALVTGLLLIVGNLDATRGTFAAFVAVMYGGFPFTVFSQLTTGPMLDVLAPEDKIGYVQGLNNSSMNLGMAVSPWVLGLLADATSTNVAIITGIVISGLAALANSPLMWRSEMGRLVIPEPPTRRPIPGEDEALVEKILSGTEFVPPEVIFALNHARVQQNKPVLVRKCNSFAQDREHLSDFTENAKHEFEFRSNMEDRLLKLLNSPTPEQRKSPKEMSDIINFFYTTDEASSEENSRELGKWIADYLKDSGYHPDVQHYVIKLMIMSAFPTISKEGKCTPDNVEQVITKTKALHDKHLKSLEPKDGRHRVGSVLGTGVVPTYFS